MSRTSAARSSAKAALATANDATSDAAKATTRATTDLARRARGGSRTRRSGLRVPLTPRAALVTTLGVGAAASGWLAVNARDRRRVAADPAAAALRDLPEGRSVPVQAGDGTALSVRVYGREDRPTVVFVHGWTCAKEFWVLQLRALAGELRLVAYDLRGHGESNESPRQDYSIVAYRDDLEEVLEATVPEGEKAILVGHSLGAMTIVAWAAEHEDEIEDRVAGAVLVSTGMGDLITSSLVLPARSAPAKVKQVAGQALLSAQTPMPKKPTPITSRSIRYVALCGAASPATVAFCEELVLSCPRRVRAGTGSALSKLALQEGIAALTVPTSVVVGRLDRLTPPVQAERLAESLPEVVESLVLEDVGHMAPVEAPEDVTRVVRSIVAHAAAEAAAAAV